MNPLEGKKTVLAVTGGIAAFKALGVLRLLKRQGADVHVVMTDHATEFLTPAGFAMLSGHPVGVDQFAPGARLADGAPGPRAGHGRCAGSAGNG